MSNLARATQAPSAPTIIPAGDITTGRPSVLAAKLDTDPYAAVQNADGTTTLVSPNASITDALTTDDVHPWRRATARDRAEQDKLLKEAGKDVAVRHDVETNDILDMMRKKQQPERRAGGMIGLRR